MAKAATSGRTNQRRRTRNDLLQAASRLMEEGRKPSLEEVAEAALVSRATAYRYFPSVESLLIEATLDIAAPSVRSLFEEDGAGDPVDRLRRVDTAFDDLFDANEVALRLTLAQALERTAGGQQGDVPVRQNRRVPLIDAALAPARGDFDPAKLRLLTRILALVIGPESRIVFRDVLQLTDEETRKTKDWALRVLVDAARKHNGRG